jgi:hypothetical protein
VRPETFRIFHNYLHLEARRLSCLRQNRPRRSRVRIRTRYTIGLRLYPTLEVVFDPFRYLIPSDFSNYYFIGQVTLNTPA